MDLIKIKKILKNNKFLNIVIRLLLVPVYFFYHLILVVNGFHRCLLRKSKKYKWILDLKNSHMNQRCFIVATGPSLTIEDLNVIKGEYSFGMNSIIKLYEKTEWRPNMYFVQDEYVFKEMENEIYWKNQSVIVPSFFKKYSCFDSKKRYYPLDMGLHRVIKKHFSFKPSKNAFYKINDGYSVIFSCIQFAIYMGFKEIYLLGSDCNYYGSKTHIVESGAVDKTSPKLIHDRLIFSHKIIHKFTKKMNVKIYNSTRGGMLEVYKRIPLEELVFEKNKI